MYCEVLGCRSTFHPLSTELLSNSKMVLNLPMTRSNLDLT